MPINKIDIKLKQSQRLDDTDYGGGQATKLDVISGEINNLYPDISRLDRTYGRVSLRKAFLQVDTNDRSTYYGAHSAITKNASDPNVSVCFFTDNDWFSQRYAAKTRIENFLVQGPQFIAALWGNHYKGTSIIQLHTSPVIDSPKNGEVFVLVSNPDTNAEKKQFVRIQKVEEEIKTIAASDTSSYKKKILTLTLGTGLQYDFEGTEIFSGVSGYNSKLKTCIYTTVVADASKYYGVSTLVEDSKVGDTQIRVDTIYTRLLPSTQSSTAITDAGIASTISAVLDDDANKNNPDYIITKPFAYRIESNGKLYIGTGVQRGTLRWNTNPAITDDGNGNILRGGTNIGSIDYSTGIITFISTVGTSIGTGDLSYVPAVAFNQVAISGCIPIEVGNRSYSYTYMCDPIPMKGTLRVDYLAGGKWYTLKDDGRGALVGSDAAIGAGQVNLRSGSVMLTLGAQPDVDSSIMLYWAQDTRMYDMSGGTYDLEYQFTTKHSAVARSSFIISWNGDSEGIVDNGKTELIVAQKNGSGEWVAVTGGEKVGKIAYATGEVHFKPGANQAAPLASENFWIRYDYGEPKTKTFPDPPRDASGRITLELHDAPINPYTVRIEWHTDLQNYGYNQSSSLYDGARKATIIAVQSQDPTHIYYDDGQGGFQGEKEDHSLVTADDIFALQLSHPNVDPDLLDYSSVTIPPGRLSRVDYANGIIEFMPDRRASYPVAVYKWRDTGQRRMYARERINENTGQGTGVWDTVTEAIEEYGFDGIKYRFAPCIFPVGGRSVKVEYRNTDGANRDNYYIDLPSTFYIKPSSKIALIPGSVQVMAGNIHLVDVGTGELYYNIDSATGIGTKCGTINYDDRVITITEDVVANNVPLNVKQIRVVKATGTLGIEPVSYVVFRAPGSPLVPGSLQLRATMGDGSLLTATSNTSGEITGAGVSGKVDFITGVCSVLFGEWVDDIYGSMPEDERPPWYAGASKNGTQVWHPYSVKASSIVVNCVVTYYLSLDPSLLGLDPVRLPIDGKVPIFRDGYIVLVHSSKEQFLPNVAADAEYDLTDASNVSDIAVYDATGLYYPEITGGTYCSDANKDKVNYTVDLVNGKITFSNNPDFNNYGVAPNNGVFEQYKTPFRAKWRVEDMCLATDVQITGHLGLSQGLTHAYKAGETLVSSVLPAGDLQSAAYNEFIQNSWDNVWSNDLRGYSPLASYNFVDFPIQVTNKGAIKERWLLRFTSSTTFDVVGENLGVILPNMPVNPTGATNESGKGGWVSIGGGAYSLVVKNILTGEAYWTMDSRGFSAGWQSGNCIRFNTDGANMPYWFVRTTLQAPPQNATDDYQFLIRGDSM